MADLSPNLIEKALAILEQHDPTAAAEYAGQIVKRASWEAANPPITTQAPGTSEALARALSDIAVTASGRRMISAGALMDLSARDLTQLKRTDRKLYNDSVGGLLEGPETYSTS